MTMSTENRLAVIQARIAAPFGHFIDGAWIAPASGEYLDVDDPATGAQIARIAAGNAADVDRAVMAARRAFSTGPWPSFPAARRAALLQALATAIDAEIDDLALLESLDTGHTLQSIRHMDYLMAQNFLRENAGWATKVSGGVPMTTAGTQGLGFWTREPVGVVGVITPWNAPTLMLLQKASPALAAGCTVVVKPAELAPLTALRLAELVKQVGFPDGVFNVVTGLGGMAGQALADHMDVNLVSFTGSTAVGKSIMASSAHSNLKRIVLELGGKSPVIVFSDANLDKAAASIVKEVVFKCGQYCAAGTRVFAQASIFEDLCQRITKAMDAVRIGVGRDSESDIGPMISEKQRARAEAILAHSLAGGARALRGGTRRAGPGYFFEPTLVVGAAADSRVMREEVFAPVVAATPFPDDADLDAIARLANDTHYGLSSKIWSQSLATVHRLARKIEAGLVVVNGGGGEGPLPFGGVKQSGYGREGGLLGIEAFTEIKSVRMGF